MSILSIHALIPDAFDLSRPNERANLSNLYLACITGNYSKATRLCDAGARLEEDDILVQAAACPTDIEIRFKLIKLLLANGADVNRSNRHGGCTALHVLCAAVSNEAANNVADCVQMLLEHGAAVDVGDDDGNLPFLLAVQTGKEKVVQLLLAHQTAAPSHS
jgi:ankyrin repeat protein